MSLKDFFTIIRQRWLIILLCVIVAAAVMFAVTPAKRDTTPRIGSYTATATLIVGSGPTLDPNQPEGPASLGRIALFITTGEVPIKAAERLGYTGDPAVLASGLKIETAPESQSITVTTTASDGDYAASVANAFAEEAVTFFKGKPEGAGNTVVTILQPATPIPNKSTSGFVIPPDRNIRTGLAALLGLIFGIALVLVLDRLDSRLRTRAEVADALRMPIVGTVPRLSQKDRRAKVVLTVTQPLSPYADGYRAVRTALVHRRALAEADAPGSVPEGGLVVLVSSAHVAEGKTTSSANLAASFAETGLRVLAIDGDLRSPSLHEALDVPQGAGISDALSSHEGSLASLMRPSNIPGVRIVTAGTKLAHPTSLVSRMGPLLAEARRIADVVIVDAAPLLEASEVFDFLPHVDSVVLVVRSGRMTSEIAHRVSELLGRFEVPVVGAVLIGAPVRKADQGYGYGYGEDKARRRSMAQAPEAQHVPSHPMPATEVRLDGEPVAAAEVPDVVDELSQGEVPPPQRAR